MHTTKHDIFEIVKSHLIDQHPNIREIKPESNWYTDLELDSFDRLEFFAWVEEKFAIRLPLYFTTVGALCDDIYKQLPQQYKETQQKQLNLLNRIKQKFIKTQNVKQ